jgi:hypothetical protein
LTGGWRHCLAPGVEVFIILVDLCCFLVVEARCACAGRSRSIRRFIHLPFAPKLHNRARKPETDNPCPNNQEKCWRRLAQTAPTTLFMPLFSIRLILFILSKNQFPSHHFSSASTLTSLD